MPQPHLRTNDDKIRRNQEKERARVLAHLRDIFKMADQVNSPPISVRYHSQDESGSLTVEEFRQAIRNPEVINSADEHI